MTLRGVFSFFKLCGLFVTCSAATAAKPKAKSGPYIVSTVSLKSCDDPILPYVTEPAFTVSAEMNSFKKSLMKGNITILKDTKNVKISVKEFCYEDGQWQMTFNVKNLSCRAQLIAILMDALGVKFDKKSCKVPKGVYSFEVSPNKLDHMWMATRDYGRLRRRIESTTRTGTVLCLEYEEIVKPAPH